MRRATRCALALAAALAAQTPSGWKVVKDSTGACQMAVPGDWEIGKPLTNYASGSFHASAMVLSQATKAVQPMSAAMQKKVGVEKMIENSPQRIFWGGKLATAAGTPAEIGYHVTVPGRDGTCVGQITIREGGSEDLVKKIAATVAAAK